MINFIIGFIVTIVSLLLGFILGKGSNPLNKETIQKVKQVFDAIPNSVIKKDIGPVERPTAQMVEDYKDPIKKAGDDETSKMFASLINK